MDRIRIKLNTKSSGSGSFDGDIEALYELIESKQDKLESGVNIVKVNGYDLLGAGELTIGGGGTDLVYYSEDLDKGESKIEIKQPAIPQIVPEKGTFVQNSVSETTIGYFYGSNTYNVAKFDHYGVNIIGNYIRIGEPVLEKGLVIEPNSIKFNTKTLATEEYIDSILGDINNRLSKI